MIFENKMVRIELSDETSAVLSVFDKVNSAEIKGEDSFFFSLVGEDKETVYIPTGISLNGEEITVETKLGNFVVKFNTFDDYFTFELVSSLPKASYKGLFAHGKYNYDYNNKKSVALVGIGLTYWMLPCFIPDGKAKETMGRVITGLKDKGAKYALITSPLDVQNAVIKKVCETADKNTSIVCKSGGPWGREYKYNFGNCIMEFDTGVEYIHENLPFYKALGVDIIDFHKVFFPYNTTFRQGDFEYVLYKDGADFKKNVVDYLKENGIISTFHTYAQLIDYGCESILADPKWQKDLRMYDSATLKEDLLEDDKYIYICEDKILSSEHGFILKTSPYLLVGTEIIEFETTKEGLKVVKRGALGTTAGCHKAGETIKQISGMYGCLTPTLGSELFYEIARRTAKAYNEGGYEGMYVDALDAIAFLSDYDADMTDFYTCAFMCEILKNCDNIPIVENAHWSVPLWVSRGRAGATDTVTKNYKNWNKFHLARAKDYIDMYMTPTMGWYNFYPPTEGTPANTLVRYHHTNDAEFLGSLSLIHNCTMTFNECDAKRMKTTPALKRNVDIYRKYDKLRKTKYFSNEFLEQFKNDKYEYHLICENDKYGLVEKEFQVKRLYDLGKEDRKTDVFSNPFEEQTPFVRIENLFSADFENGEVVADTYDFKNGGNTVEIKPCSLENKYAKKVTISSDGKDGNISIIFKGVVEGGACLTEHVIDTSFKGTRDFILIEADNGVTTPEPDKSVYDSMYACFRRTLLPHQTTEIVFAGTGDVSGVKLSEIIADEVKTRTLINPSVLVNGEKIVFNCELKSSEFIEFDGQKAKIVDEWGHEKEITFNGSLTVPKGEFEATLDCNSAEEGVIPRAQLTFGFTGKKFIY